MWDRLLIPEPATVEGFRQHSDILPTVIDLLNLKVESGMTYGTSLLRESRSDQIHFACKYNTCLGLVNDRHRFIYRYNDDNTELYRTHGDPINEHNVISELPEAQGRRYIAELREWKRQVEALY